MTIKKAVLSDGTRSAVKSKQRRPAESPAAGRQTSANSPPRRRLLANDQIGEVAGGVWQVLDERGEQTVASLKKSIDAPADLVLAAVGWLAREEKLKFVTSGRSVKVSLR